MAVVVYWIESLKKFLAIILFIIALSGCDATRLYRVDGWHEKEINTPCGQFSFHVQRGLGGTSSVGMFLFPTDSIDIQLDKILLMHRGKALRYKTEFHDIDIVPKIIPQTRFKFDKRGILYIFYNAKNLDTDPLFLDLRGAFGCKNQPLFDSLMQVKGPALTLDQFEKIGRN